MENTLDFSRKLVQETGVRSYPAKLSIAMIIFSELDLAGKIFPKF